MRIGIALILVVCVATAEPGLEQKFIAALKADLAQGRAEQTADMVAPAARKALSKGVLSAVYLVWRSNGAVTALARDPKTPFVLGKPVRFLLQQGKVETFVVCTFDANGQIAGFWFRPAPPKWSIEKIDAVVDGWSGRHAYAMQYPGHELSSYSEGGNRFPLGSIFKLYVLAELARQVEVGTLKLDQTMKLREEWKSFPSGVLHLKPAGTEVTLDELATKMIALSDNTATDHLIHLLGRENIEKNLEGLGNQFAADNRPFLTTREMFLIKGAGNEVATTGFDFPKLCKTWKKGTRAERMALLEKITAPYAKKSIAQMLGPIAAGYALRSKFQRRHLTFEWFADPADITDLLTNAWQGKIPGHKVFLKYYASSRSVYPSEGLRYSGYKGGSETNVMAMSVMAVDKDGALVAVCVCRAGDVGDSALMDVSKLTSALMRNGLER